jgi:hypothetical protein
MVVAVIATEEAAKLAPMTKAALTLAVVVILDH